ncbi:MAG: hypothetical protein PHY69_09715 [Dysgonamonadaceae bacterium]|nr:hypothetical protein [Dysgonamonadaceae bacterium]
MNYNRRFNFDVKAQRFPSFSFGTRRQNKKNHKHWGEGWTVSHPMG